GWEAAIPLFCATDRVRAALGDADGNHGSIGIQRRAAHFAARLQNSRPTRHAHRNGATTSPEDASVNGSSANTLQQIGVVHTSALCPACGLPRDYEHFDESGFACTPGPGQQVVLARFELAPQYCGL